MIAILLAPFYLLLCWYLWRRAIRWMGCCHHVFEHKAVQIGMFVVYVFLALSIVIAFFLPHSDFQRFLKLISNYWLGILLYIMLTVVVADLLRLILKRLNFPHKKKLFSRGGHAVVGTICFCVICAFSLVGIFTARHTVVTQQDITIEKDGGKLDSLHVVLIADLHLGYSIGNDHMKQMVDKINALDPDVVLVAGDIFDNEYEAVKDPDQVAKTLSRIKSKYGVYATYGNHDIEEPILAGFTFGGRTRKRRAIRGWMRLCKERVLRFCRRKASGSMTAYIFMEDRITSDRDGGSPSEKRRNRSQRVSTRASRSWCWSTSRGSCRNWRTLGWTPSFADIPTMGRCFRATC